MVVEDGDSSSGWRRLAVLAQVLRSGGGQRDLRATFRRAMTDNEAAVVGVLPDGEARTRRLPRLEYLDVRARPGAHPLEEIEDQPVDSVRHRGPAEIWPVGQCITSDSKPTVFPSSRGHLRWRQPGRDRQCISVHRVLKQRFVTPRFRAAVSFVSPPVNCRPRGSCRQRRQVFTGIDQVLSQF